MPPISCSTPAVFVGLDVALETVQLCVIDAEGRILHESTVSSLPAVIAAALSEHAPMAARVAIETGATAAWLFRELTARELPVVCIDAQHAHRALSMRRNKTDRNDARGLAELMRIGWYREANLRTLDAQRVRSMLTARRQMRMSRRDLLNQVRGIGKTFGLMVGRTAGTTFPARAREIAEADPRVGAMLLPLLDAHDAHLVQIGVYQARLRAIARDGPNAWRLMTGPGVGSLVALGFMSAIDDPTRFSSSSKVGAYLGLTPRLRHSGESSWSAGIGPAPDRMVRSDLYEAAHIVLTRSVVRSPLKAWGNRLRKRAGVKRAAVAVARKLAVLLHAIWIEGTELEKARTRVA